MQMRTMTKWMTAAGALVACLSLQPVFADGDVHERGNGGRQHFHAASPIPARPYGGGGSGGHWSGGSVTQWRAPARSDVYGGTIRGFNGYRGHVREDWHR